MEYSLIIARYGELGLKSPKVRGRFERKLSSNIKAAFNCEIDINQARIFIFPENFDEALSKLHKIFGIVSFSPAISTYSNFDDIEKTVSKYLDKLIDEGLISSDTPFAIRCRRVGKHDFSSQELAAFAGSVVVKKLGCPVDLTNPRFEIFIEVRDNETYIFHEKIKGPGGLPLGTQGKLISLVSSGIDSPVATYLMMKRGCEIIALHFDNDPYTKPKSEEKFESIVEQLKSYSSGVPFRSRVVKYGNYLNKCKEDAPEKMTCILCKSGMYKIAGMLAKDMNALGVVDGSSVGQVASQTLPNILATRDDVEVPILSPLIGLDKVEIEKIAKKIGTYDISKEYDGGCSAVPRYPETKADIERVRNAKEDINQEELINKAFGSIIFKDSVE
ncbi:thiamine biosynthesis protein ThiI [Methanobrevibacter arboriphilus JCM 13429 = DSM 1125]|uniref:Probable tRNA sulfurtransferase n=1 Tax=Methanobrevibacter arboriphilus JCM 13429 = DSM 1125 TaxID=1300164 RepID=A0A1V6N4V2_METAZ|nr:tRNA uracil 4-sulfurtransferase ThiI [Methanobrevibacter arboriphilus]OQD59689.1 thiamine biosynthesis protein ThiI [Methanobrevibacter arboriphilus JCM 13429 = DSM 1125]